MIGEYDRFITYGRLRRNPEHPYPNGPQRAKGCPLRRSRGRYTVEHQGLVDATEQAITDYLDSL
jgi:hypothetical protein